MTLIDIERLAYGGDAVGRMPDGRTVFVSGACPGDRVEVEVTEDHPRFARAKVTSIVEAGPDRVTPSCPYFGSCGGCDWQHVSSAAQAAAKRAAVVDALTRIGHIEDAESLVAQTVQSPTPYGYRNKIELAVGRHGERLVVGMHAAGSSEIVPIERCLLLPPKQASMPKAISGALRYLTGAGDLGVTRVGLRVARNTRDIEVALWTAPGAFPRATVAKTMGQALKATSIVRVLTKGVEAARTVSGVEVLAGKGHWRERLGGFTYGISAPSFFQVNTGAAERLVHLVLEALEPDGSDRVLDLYSGAGTFTLPLAELSGETVAVEAAGPAIRDLRRNLEANSLWADARGGDASREVMEVGRCDLMVVDPPRSGIGEEVVAALASVMPRTLAYVSCDPATLARDAAKLRDAGYRLTGATPVDLFPQTYHVETVARFESTGGVR